MENLAQFTDRAELAITCDIPAKLHPMSAHALEIFLANDLSWQAFARYFTLPNSAYIPVMECIQSFVNVVNIAALQ